MARHTIKVLLCAFLALGVSTMTAAAQKKDAKAKGDEKEAVTPLEEITKPLMEALKLKNEPQSIAALEKAVAAYKEKARPSRDKVTIMKLIASGIDNKNDKVKIASAGALGRIGEPASKVLQKAIKSKKIRKTPAVYAAVIDALGLTRDEKGAVGTLLNIVNRDKDWQARQWAGRALGNFSPRYAKGKTRKKICEKLIQVYEGIQSAAADGRDNVAVQRLNLIRSDFVTTLRSLTEAEWQSALDWRKWFNKAKRKRWSDPPKPKKKKKS